MLDTVDITSVGKSSQPPPDLERAVLIGDRRSLALRKKLMLKIVGDRLFFMVHCRIKLLELAGIRDSPKGLLPVAY
jgi:hypothetical protein